MTDMTKHIPSSKPDAERRLRQADRLARIMCVLQRLQSRGRWKATSITRELECSERTIHGDLTVLELGFPGHTTRISSPAGRVPTTLFRRWAWDVKVVQPVERRQLVVERHRQAVQEKSSDD